MIDSLPLFKRIAIVGHPKLPEALEEITQITSFLDGHGFLTTQGLLFDEALDERIKAGEFDLVIALGGDGTMLRAGHLCGPSGVPILGINLGSFGFLMEIRQNQWRKIMPRMLRGEYWVERRMMLRAEQWRAGELVGQWEVLNELFVGRGQTVRPVHLITDINGRFLTTYVADGLIASTPTGSTAYALAAGGPILPPELRNILLVAVAPHLSVDRPIVLAEGSTVGITVRTDHQAILSIDGQAPLQLADGDRMTAVASEHTLQFIRFQDPSYFYRNLTPHMNQNPATRNLT